MFNKFDQRCLLKLLRITNRILGITPVRRISCWISITAHTRATLFWEVINFPVKLRMLLVTCPDVPLLKLLNFFSCNLTCLIIPKVLRPLGIAQGRVENSEVCDSTTVSPFFSLLLFSSSLTPRHVQLTTSHHLLEYSEYLVCVIGWLVKTGTSAAAASMFT